MTSALEVDCGTNSFFHDKKSMSAGNSSYVHLLAGGYVVDRKFFRWRKRFIPQHAVRHYVECLQARLTFVACFGVVLSIKDLWRCLY